MLETGIGTGIVTLGTTPLIHMMNVNAAICLKYNVGLLDALKKSFSGEGGNPSNRVLNLWSGVTAHLLKESCGSVGKGLGFVYLLPELEKRDKATAPLYFASTLSVYEMGINGVDVARTKWGIGERVLLKDLSQGALGNGGRQLISW